MMVALKSDTLECSVLARMTSVDGQTIALRALSESASTASSCLMDLQIKSQVLVCVMKDLFKFVRLIL